jgi:superfamily II DNA or RNA helicase/uncharacterized protein YozE (UPF0346 family)
MPVRFFERIVNNQNIAQPRDLRDFQKPIVEDAVKYFNNYPNEPNRNNAGILALACGCGKTFISYMIDFHQQNQIVVFLVPSLYLLSQTYKEWKTEDSAKHVKRKYLLIGSDIDAELNDYKQQILLTTKQNEVEEFLFGDIEQRMVIISTYQSSSILLNVLEDKLFGPDLVVFDEAHKTCGQVNKEFSLFLKYEDPTTKKLFLTATPSFYEGSNDNVVSMKNSDIYGNVISTFNLKMAIDAKALVDYQVLISVTEENEIKALIESKKWIFDPELLQKVKSDQLHKAIVIANTIKNFGCRKILTYHKDIKHTLIFQKLLIEVFKLLFEDTTISVLQMDGSHTMRKRMMIINKFVSSEISVLCSSQVLNEGVNIPCIDSIVFVDPRKSVRDIIQCIGRCLRTYAKKELSNIIIPEIIEGNDVDESEFKDIWTIIRALKSQDSDIKDFITDRITGDKKVRTKIKFVNAIAPNTKIDEQVNIKEWKDKIMVKICHIADAWEINYQKVKAYVEENGKYPTYCSKDQEIKKLGYWISGMRRAKKGKGGRLMTQDRIDKLELLPNWAWDIDDMWNDNYEKVKKYIEENRKYPSAMSKDQEIKKLGEWISNMRRAKRGKGNRTITQERIDKLELLTNWVWEIDLNDTWNDNYEKVKKYIEENHKYPSHHSKVQEIKKLGVWISKMRLAKKGKGHALLTQERIDKLELLPNWVWDVDLNEVWNDNYEKVKKYIEENNKYPSCMSKDQEIKKLGKWIQGMRSAKKGKGHALLTQERIDKLELLPNWHW